MYRIPDVQGTGIYLQRIIFSLQEHSSYVDSHKLKNSRELQCLSEYCFLYCHAFQKVSCALFGLSSLTFSQTGARQDSGLNVGQEPSQSAI